MEKDETSATFGGLAFIYSLCLASLQPQQGELDTKSCLTQEVNKYWVHGMAQQLMQTI